MLGQAAQCSASHTQPLRTIGAALPSLCTIARHPTRARHASNSPRPRSHNPMCSHILHCPAGRLLTAYHAESRQSDNATITSAKANQRQRQIANSATSQYSPARHVLPVADRQYAVIEAPSGFPLARPSFVLSLDYPSPLAERLQMSFLAKSFNTHAASL